MYKETSEYFIYIIFFNKNVRENAQAWNNKSFLQKINVRSIIYKNARVLCNTRKTY